MKTSTIKHNETAIMHMSSIQKTAYTVQILVRSLLLWLWFSHTLTLKANTETVSQLLFF